MPSVSSYVLVSSMFKYIPFNYIYCFLNLILNSFVFWQKTHEVLFYYNYWHICIYFCLYFGLSIYNIFPFSLPLFSPTCLLLHCSFLASVGLFSFTSLFIWLERNTFHLYYFVINLRCIPCLLTLYFYYL